MSALSPGTVVADRFRIVGALGSGGMGAVYRALQEPLDREVALKVIRDPSASADTRARFVREAKAVAALSDPSIVTVYDFGVTADGLLFLAMELVDGETLEARLRRLGRLPVSEGAALVGALARCLAVAHADRIVHRDVKPANIMVPPTGGVKLLDFGLARRTADGAASVTEQGIIVGSPGYIPPEVVLVGRSDDPRSDVYALGVVAYEVLTGHPPFSAATPMALVMKHAQERPPRFDEVAPGAAIPRELSDLVMAMLEKAPGARPSSAEVARLLGAGSGPRPAPSGPMTAEASSVSTTFASGRLARPSQPSIAVLPFANLSSDTEQEFFADGLTEDVICGLARHPSLFVIGRATAFAFKGQKVSTQFVGRELGVRYVVEGSVRRSSQRVRVTVTLVDTDSSTQLWSQRFDRDVADAFEVQDDITGAIVSALPGRIEAAHLEKARKRPTEDLAAFDLVLRARELHHRGSAGDNLQARGFLDRAVELDQEYVQAHVWRACVIGQGLIRGYTKDRNTEVEVAEMDRSMKEVVARGADDPECLRMLAEMAMGHRDFDGAARTNERALKLVPGEPRLLAQRGEIFARAGRGAEAVEWIERAIRLDPFSEQTFWWPLALARFGAGDLLGARRVLEGISGRTPKHHALLAIVHHLLGEPEPARQYYDLLVAGIPEFSTGIFHAMCPFGDEHTRSACIRALLALGAPDAPAPGRPADVT